jgi:hypothetical protein
MSLQVDIGKTGSKNPKLAKLPQQIRSQSQDKVSKIETNLMVSALEECYKSGLQASDWLPGRVSSSNEDMKRLICVEQTVKDDQGRKGTPVTSSPEQILQS